MKVTIALLVVFSVAVSLCVALPYAEREEVTDEAASARARRSPLPEDKKEPRGRVRTKVQEESGVGLKASVQGEGTLYESDDGKSKIKAEGSWSKVLDGPQKGKPEHKGGVSWDIEW